MTISEERDPSEIAEEVALAEQLRADEIRSDSFLASLEDSRIRPRASYRVDPELLSWQI